jgi:hypothetical protein
MAAPARWWWVRLGSKQSVVRAPAPPVPWARELDPDPADEHEAMTIALAMALAEDEGRLRP